MKTATHQRINITLPQATLRLLDSIAPARGRSSLIDEAVRSYAKGRSKAEFRKRLAEGYRVRAKEDLEMANERYPGEEELWFGNEK